MQGSCYVYTCICYRVWGWWMLGGSDRCCFSRDCSDRVSHAGPRGGHSWQKVGQMQSPEAGAPLVCLSRWSWARVSTERGDLRRCLGTQATELQEPYWGSSGDSGVVRGRQDFRSPAAATVHGRPTLMLGDDSTCVSMYVVKWIWSEFVCVSVYVSSCLNVCLCMFECMCAWVIMCVSVWVYMCSHVCVYVCVFRCLCLFVCTCVYTCVCLCFMFESLTIHKAGKVPTGNEILVGSLSWHPGWVSVLAMGHRTDQCHWWGHRIKPGA